MIEINSLIYSLHNLPPEISILLNYIICYLGLIVFAKFWQEKGLILYSSIAVIVANMQVLKAVKFTWYPEPIALGTLVYTSTFIASDILVERYGAISAKRSVWMGFTSSILMLLLIIPALGIRPLDGTYASSHGHFNLAHDALMAIFTPSAAIIVASLSAYLASQMTDIYVFSRLRNATSGKYLWLRVLFSVMVAILIDILLFNILAWKIFAPFYISWKELFVSYIITGYFWQIFTAMLNIPVFYLLLKILKEPRNVS